MTGKCKIKDVSWRWLCSAIPVQKKPKTSFFAFPFNFSLATIFQFEFAVTLVISVSCLLSTHEAAWYNIIPVMSVHLSACLSDDNFEKAST